MPKENDATAGLLQKSAVALKEMQDRLNAIEGQKHEPIAIIGMACRLPGHSDTPERFWEGLEAGRDMISEIPAERWDLEAFFDPDPGTQGKMYTRGGGFVDNIDQFDPEVFGIAPREALSLDPQQRMLLETSWEALERAGIAPDSLVGSDTGVFVGISSQDYFQHTMVNRIDIDPYSGTGVGMNVASGRISYVLGLQGPNSAVDTACSSSLVSLHMAIRSLRAGECSMALAGGVNAIINPMLTVYFCKLGALSPDSRCKTFDASANGYARGEGAGMVVLKRLGDAQRDGDNIVAVLRGSAINHDGRSGGLTVPNGPAQKAVLRAALKDAQLDPSDVSYIEAHGTGTPLGDPIEMHALIDIFSKHRDRNDPLTVGSVKTNIGHLEAAAGIAGVIKVVMAMQNQKIPQHLHLKQLNPHISLNGAAVQFPETSLDWPLREGRARVAGISSFGISGTNAHVLVEEAPAPQTPADKPARTQHLLPLSARSDNSLAELAGRLHDHLTAHPNLDLEQVCRTAANGRCRMPLRAAVKAENLKQMLDRLKSLARGKTALGLARAVDPTGSKPRVAFVFSGQGAQSQGMGRELYAQEPLFREALDRADKALQPHMDCSIIEVMHATSDDQRLNQTAFTQPALFALEYALAELWRAWGVEPELVMGHSVGEFAAACVAGVLTLEDAAQLIATRGRLMQELPQGGGMTAIFAPLSQVEELIKPLAGKVGIAAANTPRNTVVSGEQGALDALMDRLAAEGIQSTALIVSHAFHSHLMEPMLNELQQVAAQLTHRQPAVRFISNLSGEAVEKDTLGPEYWTRHARQPVMFEKGLRNAVAAGCDLFLEIGPHATLITMAQQIVEEDNLHYVTSLKRGENEWDVLSDAVAELHTHGAPLNWKTFFEQAAGSPVILPTYPFEREHYWIERNSMLPGDANSASANLAVAGENIHVLLGQRLQTAGSELLFHTTLSSDNPTWLADHAVDGQVIFPATGYWELALAGAKAAAPSKHAVLQEVAFEAPLTLQYNEKSPVQTILRPDGDGMAFEVHSFKSDEAIWQRHALGRIVFTQASSSSSLNIDALTEKLPESHVAQNNYARMRSHGMEYGKAFQGITELRSGERASLARIHRPTSLPTEDLVLHPALSDACLQALGVTFSVEGDDTLYLPVALDQLEVLASLPEAFYCYAQLNDGDGETLSGDLKLLSDDGELLAIVTGVRLRKTSLAAVKRSLGSAKHTVYHTPGWVEHPLGASQLEHQGVTVIISDKQGVATRLSENLSDSGLTLHTITTDALTTADAAAATLSESLNGQPISQVVALLGCDLSAASQSSVAAISAAAALNNNKLLTLIQGLSLLGDKAPALTLVTCGAQSVAEGPCVTAPEAAILWGFGRVVQSELPMLRTVLCDLDPADVPGSIAGLAQQLQQADHENQIAWRHGVRYAARLATAAEPQSQTRELLQLQIPQRGELSALSLAPVAAEQPRRGQIKIAVHATGLNFRDVLNALDMYPGDPGPLGGECAGIIVALGDGVEGLKAGDRVTGIAPGSFRTEVLADARQVAVIPPEMDFAGAATLPIAFLTAHYALNRLGGMKKGDRVLIHAAAGGVGQAAVQLAKNAGAEIFATAGNPDKRALLKRQGVDHVMDSRSVDFAQQVMEITEGLGVDLVLNSLVGEALTKSLALVREGGRFLEIGKMELLDEAALQAWPGLEYHTIALDSLSASDPAMVGGMLGELMVHFREGRLVPLSWHGFSLDKALDAFRFMQQARHIGKIVITQSEAAQRPMPVLGDATYLITGGLGGLGLCVAEHLAERGAGALALMSRRAPSEEVQQRLQGITAKGCKVTCLQADVADRDALEEALKQLQNSELPPLRGLIHAAGVLDDGAIAQQTPERFSKVMAPKVQGAWNLHELTQNNPIDVFVMFSSAAAVMGAAGQSNYAAANSFLDALAHYRHARGLAAVSINWGPWTGAGMAAELDESGAWEARGMLPITLDQGMAMLDSILGAAPPQIMVLPIDWQQFLSQLPPGAELPLLNDVVQNRNSGNGEDLTGNSGGLQVELEQLPEGARYQRVQEVVEEQLLKVLGMNAGKRVDPRQPLNDLGLDSLLAVELRNALVRIVAQPLSATLLFDYPNVAALTDYLAEEVLSLTSSDSAETRDSQQTEADAVAELSDVELRDSLEDELRRAGF